MIPYAQLTPGPGWRPVRSLLYYTQRAVGWERPRKRVVSAITAKIQRAHPIRINRPPDELLRHGLVELPDRFPIDAVDKMTAYLREKDVLLPSGQRVDADEVPSGTPFVNYPLSTVVNCPHVIEIANDPKILSIACDYLGCRPTISSMGIRWSFPNSEAATVQGWHRDNDDWKYVKFFMYLTDVDEGSGPHVFVIRSHKGSIPIRGMRYTEDYITKLCGKFSRRRITGKRGTMFMADTSGIHKGEVPTNRPRLMLEVGYSLLPIYAFQYTPEVLHSVLPQPINRYTNRLILKRMCSIKRVP
jgi:hypothetical protein